MRLLIVLGGDEPHGGLLCQATALAVGAPELEVFSVPSTILAEIADFTFPTLTVLEAPEGKLFGATAICRYLAGGSALEPRSHADDALLEWAEHRLAPAAAAGALPEGGLPAAATLTLGHLAAFSVLHPLQLGAEAEAFCQRVAALSGGAVERTLASLQNVQPAKMGLKVKSMLGARSEAVDPNLLPRRPRPPLPAEVLPVAGQRNVLVTSALPYVNNVPHLGNIIGSTLSADVYARFCRLRGYNTIYICGTDEYGTASETAAMNAGVTPREICDFFREKHVAAYRFFELEFDHFGRTSCADPHAPENADWPHTQIAQDIFLKLHANGHLQAQSTTQTYCVQCDRFLADRLVSGTCPKCGYDDARGDQCDGCAELLNAVELLSPKCSRGADHTVEVRDTEHMYLDLQALQPRIQAFVSESSAKGQWSPNAITTTQGWLDGGLLPRCITRDLRWGTPVPLPGFEKRVFYVWYGAPLGYLSISANYTSRWREWWQNPEEVELVQFMGKDNVPFHTIIFPASLIGSSSESAPWTLPHHVSATEYLNYENDKFSKSRGKGVFGDMAAETGVPAEVWRYYLLANRPEAADSQFLWQDFQDKNNNELLKSLGNFAHRAMSFTYSRFEQASPAAYASPTERDAQFVAAVNALLAEYLAHMEAVRLKDGLRTAMKISHEGNKYLQDEKPWVLLKQPEGATRAGAVLLGCLSLTYLLSAVLDPFMPGFTDKVLHMLNRDHCTRVPEAFAFDEFPTQHALNEPQPIFRVISDAEVEGFRERFSGQQ